MKILCTIILMAFALLGSAQEKPALEAKQKENIPAAGIKVPGKAKLNILTGRLPGFFRPELPPVTRSKRQISNTMPVIFADSKLIDFYNHLPYILPDEIEDINIDSRSAKYPNGALYIKLKDHQKLVKLLEDKLMSIKDISFANVAQADKNKPVIYLIDNEFITDTAGIRIPSRHVLKVTVTPAAETPYFKTAMPGILLMMIETRPPVQYIKGTDGSQE